MCVPSNPGMLRLYTDISPDSLPDRPYTHHRNPEDLCVLCATSKTQRHGRLHGRNTPHPVPVAIDRISDRTLRHLRPLWRLLRHDSFVRWKYTFRGSLHTNGSRKDLRWSEERRVASMREANRMKNIPVLPVGPILSQALKIASDVRAVLRGYTWHQKRRLQPDTACTPAIQS